MGDLSSFGTGIGQTEPVAQDRLRVAYAEGVGIPHNVAEPAR
ncbi:hypothetical protein SAMN05421539_12912 [Jannaschia seohaensis]|uniref:Uncharacterized protein n=1 Tax=Jannaschia seohaensis TaxID=475081 RepID=A0A2Y9BA93_9RHOB|nr:hypothetical protein BCF38_12912 [Jannaschia seohaensis]SSA51947.1 hypothetical protein SAMN05421539_12912 [Jannaschia seohaensis]